MIGTLLGFILLATLIVILIQIEKAHGSFNDYFIGCNHFYKNIIRGVKIKG